MSENYVLAMYDVRGKQDFIYRSNKCKEIIGGSRLIRDVFQDYLFKAAKEYCEKWGDNENPCDNKKSERIYQYGKACPGEGEEVECFSVETFKKRMDTSSYIGEVVYEGGGNFFVLYRNKEICIGINRIFTKKLLKKVGTLHVLCTYIDNLDFNDYQGDQRRLRRKHQIHEAQESVIGAVNTTPFTAVSPEGSRPYTGVYEKVGGQGEEKVTTEQKAKYEKYATSEKDLYDENLLDNLVTKRGEESLLAVIYIDGNGMGAKVARHLNNRKNYDDCVSELRRFSMDIDKNYVQERRKSIDEKLLNKHKGDQSKVRRTIVAAGDEMTIICNARDALDVVKAYFNGLNPDDGSSCAGIAIFHSHSPYSEAYRIAEECCENAKSVMKRAGVENVNLMDFHYCMGGTGISLERIRERENTENQISRPWRIDKEREMLDPDQCVDEKSDIRMKITPVFSSDILKKDAKEKNISYEDAVNRMVNEWKDKELARTNIKVLRDASQVGVVKLRQEISRINAHRPKDKPITFEIVSEKGIGNRKDVDEENSWGYRRRLIYDISMIYDLWFRGE